MSSEFFNGSGMIRKISGSMELMSKFPNDPRMPDLNVSRNRNRTTLYGRVGTDELGRKVQLFEILTS